jgi:hypothetical protein
MPAVKQREFEEQGQEQPEAGLERAALQSKLAWQVRGRLALGAMVEVRLLFPGRARVNVRGLVRSESELVVSHPIVESFYVWYNGEGLITQSNPGLPCKRQ